MGAPSVSVAFIEQAKTVIQRGERGVIAMLLVDSAAEEETSFTVTTVKDIPTTISDDSILQLKLALIGNDSAPKKIYVLVQQTADYDAAFEYFSTMTWNYFVSPTAETDGATDSIVAWIKEQREDYALSCKAVLSNADADYEAIVNVANGCTYDGTTDLTAEQMCARVAGIICGTSLTKSVTYAALDEMTDCDRMTTSELSAAVDAGKLVFMWDGEKVKICRGVNSFITTTDTKGDSFKKIKLVDAMDMIKDDITTTAQDSYIGKFANTYDNKCLLITAINEYFSDLVDDSVLQSGTCSIDVDANEDYLEDQGEYFVYNGEKVYLDDATEDQLKKASTGSYVFLTANIALIDAVEDIELEIYLG